MSPPIDAARADVYPPHTVERLLRTDLVTAPTRRALEARLEERSAPPRFFPPALYAVLDAACGRLIPQPDPGRRVDVAGGIDARIARDGGDGWRYAALPPDAQAYTQGLGVLDGAAHARCGAGFADLSPDVQDQLLGLCQAGEFVAEDWSDEAGRRWFEELCVEAAEIYYSHPWAQSDIGYVGMADALGWKAIGLDEREPYEPLAAPLGVGTANAPV